MGGRGAVACAVLGWAGLVLGGPRSPWFALATLALAWGMLATRRVRMVPLAFLALGAARMTADDVRFAAGVAARPTLPAVVRCEAEVVEPARREGDAPAVVVRVLAARPRWPRDARLALRLPADCPADWGDTIRVLARLDTLSGARVPGGFDARAAARAGARLASGRAFTVQVRPARGAGTLVPRALMRVRRACESALRRGLSREARELAAPLLFGDRGGMDTDTDAALRASGLVHLLALSGLHVAWLAAVVRAAAALAGAGVGTRACLGALGALTYAGLAGPIPSLARAVVAEALTALARVTGRALDPVQALAVAVLALLTWRPAWSLDLGFQLSCAATLGLVVVGGALVAAAERHASAAPLAVSGRARLARGAHLAVALVLRVTAPTLGAQLVALPLLLARFHALPWTSLVANLVAVPIAELLLAAAGLGALLDAWLPGTGHVGFAASEPLAAVLHAIMRAFGGTSWAVLPAGASPWPCVCAVVAVALATLPMFTTAPVAPVPPPTRARRLAARGALVAALLSLAWLVATPSLRPPPGRWWLVVLDVGQGDAIAVGGADGWWLVDTGPRTTRWDAGEGAVLPFLRTVGVRRLESLVLTHDDNDHTGGARAVMRGVPVRHVRAGASRPGVPGPAAHVAVEPLVRGDAIALDPGARVLWPPAVGARDEGLARRGDNAAAVVLEVGGGAGRAWLMADADSVVEHVLVPRPDVAVLKAGHHGSGSSSGAAFVTALRPRVVALSCGAHNAYGHPDARACARLARTGARLDRTDREGTLWYELDAHGVRRLDWRSGEPWRRHPPP